MHATEMLPDFLKTHNPQFHKGRLKTLALFVDAICHGAVMTMAGLGRAINAPSEKIGIKRSYEFLTNSLLYGETGCYGSILAKCVITNILHPIILIDWTEMPSMNKRIYALTAAIPRRGRTQPIYSKTYSEKQYNTNLVHDDFLEKLATILPPFCKPIIVTDAGFKGPWCKTVASMGWYYITRVRSNSNIKLKGHPTWFKLAKQYKLDKNRWMKPAELHVINSSGYQFLGDALLNKSDLSPLDTKIFYYKKKYKGRKDKGRFGQVRGTKESRIHAKSSREPWVLSTNIPDDGLPDTPHPIVIYKKRMKIEETFRDMKSARFGSSLSFARSNCLVTWNNLLLLASIALLLLYVIGMHAEQKQLHYRFQANTIRFRRVLSFTYLGKQILKSIQKNIENSLFTRVVLDAFCDIKCAF